MRGTEEEIRCAMGAFFRTWGRRRPWGEERGQQFTQGWKLPKFATAQTNGLANTITNEQW